MVFSHELPDVQITVTFRIQPSLSKEDKNIYVSHRPGDRTFLKILSFFPLSSNGGKKKPCFWADHVPRHFITSLLKMRYRILKSGGVSPARATLTPGERRWGQRGTRLWAPWPCPWRTKPKKKLTWSTWFPTNMNKVSARAMLWQSASPDEQSLVRWHHFQPGFLNEKDAWDAPGRSSLEWGRATGSPGWWQPTGSGSLACFPFDTESSGWFFVFWSIWSWLKKLY